MNLICRCCYFFYVFPSICPVWICSSGSCFLQAIEIEFVSHRIVRDANRVCHGKVSLTLACKYYMMEIALWKTLLNSNRMEKIPYIWNSTWYCNCISNGIVTRLADIFLRSFSTFLLLDNNWYEIPMNCWTKNVQFHLIFVRYRMSSRIFHKSKNDNHFVQMDLNCCLQIVVVHPRNYHFNIFYLKKTSNRTHSKYEVHFILYIKIFFGLLHYWSAIVCGTQHYSNGHDRNKAHDQLVDCNFLPFFISILVQIANIIADSNRNQSKFVVFMYFRTKKLQCVELHPSHSQRSVTCKEHSDFTRGSELGAAPVLLKNCLKIGGILS